MFYTIPGVAESQLLLLLFSLLRCDSLTVMRTKVEMDVEEESLLRSQFSLPRLIKEEEEMEQAPPPPGTIRAFVLIGRFLCQRRGGRGKWRRRRRRRSKDEEDKR